MAFSKEQAEEKITEIGQVLTEIKSALGAPTSPSLPRTKRDGFLCELERRRSEVGLLEEQVRAYGLPGEQDLRNLRTQILALMARI